MICYNRACRYIKKKLLYFLIYCFNHKQNSIDKVLNDEIVELYNDSSKMA